MHDLLNLTANTGFFDLGAFAPVMADLGGIQTKLVQLITQFATLIQIVGTVLCIAGFTWGAVKIAGSSVDVQSDMRGKAACIAAVVAVIMIWVGPTIINNFATSSGGQAAAGFN